MNWISVSCSTGQSGSRNYEVMFIYSEFTQIIATSAGVSGKYFSNPRTFADSVLGEIVENVLKEFSKGLSEQAL